MSSNCGCVVAETCFLARFLAPACGCVVAEVCFLVDFFCSSKWLCGS